MKHHPLKLLNTHTVLSPTMQNSDGKHNRWHCMNTYRESEQNTFHAITTCSLWSTPSEHSNIYAALMGHHHLEHKHTHTAMAHTMHNSSETQHACMHSAPALSPQPQPSTPALSPSVHSALAPASERSLSSNKKQAATERAKRAEFFYLQ